MIDTLQIGLLGPVQAQSEGRRVCLGGRNERLVFTALALALNHAVSHNSLIAAIWNDDPPAAALDTLQSTVSRLRSRIGSDVIKSVDHSYCLTGQPDNVDIIRFERLMAEASSSLTDDPETAASLATKALALWRGTPFGELSGVPCLEPESRRLEAFRVGTVQIRLEADVARGRLTSAIAGLKAEIAENPYRERLWYLLILALARDGQRVDALRQCQQLRADLAEVGLRPSSDITELEEMVLNESSTVRSQLHRRSSS